MKAKEIAEVETTNLPQPWWQKTELEPAEKLTQAKKYAVELANLIDKNNLFSMIKSKKYVLCEGWTALAGLLGVFANTDYCKRRDDEKDACIYDARVFLQTTDGRIIATAESVCSSRENNWRNRDEYAIKSMAQTRATAKACRLAFSWIMVLAGYEPTPAEEMDNSDSSGSDDTASEKQVAMISKNILGSHLLNPLEQYLIQKKINEESLTKTEASTYIDWWIGDKSERKHREKLEKESKEVLKAYLAQVENKLKDKYPNDYKEFLQLIKN